MLRRLNRERKESAQAHASAANFLIDLQNAIEGLERNRETLLQELAHREIGAALQKENRILTEKSDRLKREIEEKRKLEDEKRALQVTIATFQSLKGKRAELNARKLELEERMEEFNGKLDQIGREKVQAEYDLRVLKEKAKLVEPEIVKMKWRKEFNAEILRLESQIQDLEIIVELGNGLADDFGWSLN
jgi:seryl-tRNA synthetase